ncbi:MAG: hypothetical protein JSV21_01595 [Nitrospirota bacterium]|nr:MAG: hypothetical protein JSV21_01595 [Nitrospirota bacterium]
MAQLIQIGTRIINIDNVNHIALGYVTVISKGERKKKVKEAKLYFEKGTITFTDAEADVLLQELKRMIGPKNFKAIT